MINSNLFIIGGVASGKTSIIELFRDFGYKTIDTGLIYRFATYSLMNEYHQNQNNLDLESFLTKKSQHLTNMLRKHLSVADNEIRVNGIDDINSTLFSEHINSNIINIAKSKPIRKVIINWITSNFGDKDRVILTGHNIREFNTTKYVPVLLKVNNSLAAKRLLNRNPEAYSSLYQAYQEIMNRNEKDGIKETEKIISGLYNPIIVEVDDKSVNEVFSEVVEKIKKHETTVNNLANGPSVSRNNFCWIKNPYFKSLKQCLLNNTQFTEAVFWGLNQQDLLIQTLTHLSKYSPEDLHNLKKDDVILLNNAIEKRDINFLNEAYPLLQNINMDIVDAQLNCEIKELNNLYLSSGKHELLRSINKDSPFGKEFPTQILSEKSNHLNDELILKEQRTGKNIHFREIDEETSHFYTKYLHYLHSPRDDEYKSFGAFVEDSSLPFAIVSFSRHDREYKKAFLEINGIESHNTLEMTRAWAAPWAPKNTMSFLFQYSFDELKKDWKNKLSRGEVDKKLAAITTTINPNLDFSGSSFLGSNFIPFAFRPAKFTFINGRYTTRREANLTTDNQNSISESKILNIPLNELIVCFDKELQASIMKQNIYEINKGLYNKISRKNNNVQNFNSNNKSR